MTVKRTVSHQRQGTNQERGQKFLKTQGETPSLKSTKAKFELVEGRTSKFGDRSTSLA